VIVGVIDCVDIGVLVIVGVEDIVIVGVIVGVVVGVIVGNVEQSVTILTLPKESNVTPYLTPLSIINE